MKKYRNTMRYAAHAFGRGVRVFAKLDIAQARTEAEGIRKRLDADRKKLAGLQMSGKAKDDELRALRDRIRSDAQRYDDIMGAVRMVEDEQIERVAGQFNRKLADRVKNRKAVLGSLYKSLLQGAPFEPLVRSELSLPLTVAPTDGPYLLPKNVSDEILHDIFNDDSILQEITMTQVTGLSYPKVEATRVDEAADAPEGTDPNAIKLEGGELVFSRFSYAAYIDVPSALLRGTDTALETLIDEELRADAQDFICNRIFGTKNPPTHAHMSVYDDTVVKIKQITAADELTGIIDALADLPTKVRRVAKVTLTPVKWLRLVRELANGAQTLFGRPDEGVLGFTPVLCDYAAETLVGDLSTIHCNWDDPLGFEKERSAKHRITTAVISGYYDIHVKNPAKLRRVKVEGAPDSLSVKAEAAQSVAEIGPVGLSAEAVAAINRFADAVSAGQNASGETAAENKSKGKGKGKDAAAPAPADA